MKGEMMAANNYDPTQLNENKKGRAWSDSANHVIIVAADLEIGVTTKIALELYLDLKKAIKDSL
ncbi:MAG: hypothetical protein ABIF22_02920 [bacterium]